MGDRSRYFCANRSRYTYLYIYPYNCLLCARLRDNEPSVSSGMVLIKSTVSIIDLIGLNNSYTIGDFWKSNFNLDVVTHFDTMHDVSS